jgi:hypothetical protein
MMGPLLSHFGLGSPQEFVPFFYRRFDKAAEAAPRRWLALPRAGRSPGRRHHG